MITKVSDNPASFRYFGVCHNDFNSGNLLYTRSTKGVSGRLAILDFGLAKYVGNIYEEFGNIACNFSEGFLRALVNRYNCLAKERCIDICIDIHLVLLWRLLNSFCQIRNKDSFKTFCMTLNEFDLPL